MKTCIRSLKFIVTFLNCLIMILGLAIFGLFIWIYVELATMLSSNETNYLFYISMGIGFSMAMMGFLGCCGALQESQCILGTFAALAFIIFGGQISMCIWVYTNFDRIENNVRSAVKDSLTLYGKNDIFTASMDVTQQQLKCCGSNGPKDWYKIQQKTDNAITSLKNFEVPPSKKFEVPPSCCIRPESCQRTVGFRYDDSSIYKTGCSDRLFTWLRKHQKEILFAVIPISLIEIFAIIFSLILCATVRKLDEDDFY